MATTVMKRSVLVLVIIVSSLMTLFGQDQEDYTQGKHYPSVMLGIGGIKFTGDVGKKTDVNPLLDARIGYYLKAEYRFGKYFGLMAGGLYGKFAGTDNAPSSHLNFQSKITQADLSFVTYFDHLFKQNDDVSPYLTIGAGYLMFDPYGDLKNSSATYYYWSDGSIRDLPETPVNVGFSTIVKRDYKYETQLKDSLSNYKRSSVTIPIGTGFDFNFGHHRWDVQVGFNYNLILSDYADNYKSGGNDSYWMGHVGLKYTFAPKPKTAYDNVDFKAIDKLDVDEDGVPDDEDRCLSTPKGVKVDKNGCPPDGDKDGIADYMDKEPNSKKGAKVDGNGVTFNEDSLAYHQIMWDSLAADRSDKFNENPSMETLKKIENSEVKKPGTKVPDALKPADINSDGYISADEISKTIDAFFEGSNDFTVERINQLIDYFFEQ